MSANSEFEQNDGAQFEAHWSRHLLRVNYLALALVPWLGIMSIYVVTQAVFPTVVGALYLAPVGVVAGLLLRRMALASAMVISEGQVRLHVGQSTVEIQDSDAKPVRVTRVPTGSLHWITFTVGDSSRGRWKWIVFVASDAAPVSALQSRGIQVRWLLGVGDGRE